MIQNEIFNSPETGVPVITTFDLVIFPGSTLVVRVQSEHSLAAVKHAQAGNGWVVALGNRDDDKRKAGIDTLAKIGVIARVKDVTPFPDGHKEVVLEAYERFQALKITKKDGCYLADGALVLDKHDADEATLGSLGDSLKSTAIEILKLLPTDTSQLVTQVDTINDPKELSYFAAQYMNLARKEAQEVLETTSIKNRLLRLLELLAARKENLKVQFKIREALSESVGQKQRESLLREQLKAIQNELGDGAHGPSADDYRERVAKANMPDDAKEVALREVSRLERMGDQSPESSVIRNYLDLLCEMPWNKTSEGEIDLVKAEEILNRDHYGLEKIKRRILEHLAVMKLRPEKRGSILLFIGPPGVGKTSLGKSIAEALGRQFVRVSLGGVRDDADIRGHRRTYVGALPGRIVDGIRRAKSKDPVFVLDEVDKLGRGWGGDPASALLEVLDPEQNNTFHDHYLDVSFDLSQVIFIATANNRETIPGPLLDRMEVIELTGYTTDEKFHIAKQHLFPEEIENHGLKDRHVELTDAALNGVIEGYTREAGVRSLRRELAKVARYIAARIAKDPEQSVLIDRANLAEALGPVRFELEEFTGTAVPGVVTGMAWTPVGGDVLFVEAAEIPGDGKVAVTGQLGDVMKESSQISVALARSRLEHIAKNVLYKDRDIHIHVPGGAVPKDGPSAGVTMFTAVASMMLGRSVDPRLAMTGEVTLLGKILPVGGIKEKVLAAARFGVQEILLPTRNAKDLDELPKEVLSKLKIHLVSNIDELLVRVFGPLAPRGNVQISKDEVTSSHGAVH